MDFEKYDLLIDTLDYSAFSLTGVRQQAVQWNGELEFGFVILDKKRFQLAIHQGIQSQLQRSEVRVSTLESPYQLREITVPIANSFRFGSALYTGINTKMAITSRIGLAIDYHYQYSLSNTTINWPAQHVLDAGIYYTIK